MDLVRFVIRHKKTGKFVRPNYAESGEPRIFRRKSDAALCLSTSGFILGDKDDYEIVACVLNIPDQWKNE